MPTYSYRCTECGNAFDIVQAFTDDSLTECPSCGGRLRKLFHAVGVTFSGSGFYRTDSRASAKGAGDGGGTEKAGAGVGGGKRDAGAGAGKGGGGSSGSTAAPAGSGASGGSPGA